MLRQTRHIAIAGAIMLILAGETCATAQGAKGQSDLQGVWSFDWQTPLERPPEAGGPTLTPEEARIVSRAIDARREAGDPLQEFYGDKPFFAVRGELRSSLVVDPKDGRLPYTTEARARAASFPRPDRGDDVEARPPNERCLLPAGAAPYVPMPAQNFLTIVQTPSDVVMHTELMSLLRIIPVDGRKPPIGSPQQQISARWEDGALVVESTGFRGPSRGVVPMATFFLVSPQTRLKERFARTGPDEINYTFTVTDPALYTRPWSAEMILRRTQQPVFENACHEGNYALTNILQGARRIDRDKARGD